MSKDAIFTLTFEQKLRDEFVAAAEALDLSPSDVLVDLMQDFIQQQQMAPDYLTFLKKKAEIARDELAAEQGLSEEDVKYEFAARRAAAAAKIR